MSKNKKPPSAIASHLPKKAPNAIPTREEFQKAAEASFHRMNRISALTANFKSEFASAQGLTYFELLRSSAPYIAYLSFATEADVRSFEQSGTLATIDSFLREELIRQGFATNSDIKLSIETDFDDRFLHLPGGFRDRSSDGWLHEPTVLNRKPD